MPRRSGPNTSNRGKGRAAGGASVPPSSPLPTSRPTQTAQRAAEPLIERPHEIEIQVTVEVYQYTTKGDGQLTNKKLDSKGGIARVKPGVSYSQFVAALDAQVKPYAGKYFQGYELTMPQFRIPKVPLFEPRSGIARPADLRSFIAGLESQGWPIPHCYWTIQLEEAAPAAPAVRDGSPDDLPIEARSPSKKARKGSPNKRSAAAALQSERVEAYENNLAPHLEALKDQWPLCSRVGCRGGQSQGGCCYVDAAGEHFYLAPIMLRRWATRMMHDPVTFTVEKPPNNVFDRPVAPRGTSSSASLSGDLATSSSAGDSRYGMQSSSAGSIRSSSSGVARAFADRTNISQPRAPDESDDDYSVTGVQEAIKALHEPVMTAARGPTMSTLHFIQEAHHGSHQIVIVLARLGITDMDVLADAYNQGEIVGKYIDVIVLRTIKSWLIAWAKLDPSLKEDKRKLRADEWMLEKAVHVSMKSGFKAAAVDLLPRPTSAYPMPETAETPVLTLGSESPSGAP